MFIVVYGNVVGGFVSLLVIGDHHGNFKMLLRKRYPDVPLVRLIIDAIASTEHWLVEIILISPFARHP